METRLQEIRSRSNKEIKIGIIPGHFATNHSHVNYYVDLTSIKSRHKMAKAAASELAQQYLTTTPIDTIICLEGTETIGAFLADALSQSGSLIMNSGNDICVLTPELNANNQMIFRDNTQKWFGAKIFSCLSPRPQPARLFRALSTVCSITADDWSESRPCSAQSVNRTTFP